MKTFLIWILFVAVSFGQTLDASSQAQPQVLNFGWTAPSTPESILTQENAYTQQLKGLVRYNDDSDAFIYRYLFRILKEYNQLTQEELESGRLNSLDQKNFGFCVGFSGALCVDTLKACDIYVRNQQEVWKIRSNPIAIYSLGRHDNRGSYDGSSGAWQTAAYNKYGTLFRLKYDSYDLINLDDGNIGRQWASKGIPKDLLKFAEEHKIISCALVRTIDEAKAAISNGYPITICAAASYGNTRDRDGFIKLSGRAWNHSMTVNAYRSVSSGREGFLITNSWGNNWCGGPIYPNDQPHGSFWVTPEDLLFHLQQNDSYAIAGFEGFKKRSLKWDEIFKVGEEINVEDN